MAEFNRKYDLKDWLPITTKELKLRNWEALDIILITGDAYVDHPSFGIAVIGRVLEHEGFRVGIIPQPNWQDDLRDFKKLGKPRLFFGITAGNMDSMVNHYTANKRLRSTDAYTPGNKSGFRPDYATKVYTKIIKSLFPDTPVVIGGIEASLRRFTHYDYWSDKLMPSILAETKADLLVYGLGEKTIVDIAKQLDNGKHIKSLTNLAQTAYLSNKKPTIEDLYELNSHEECVGDKYKYAHNFKIIETESNRYYPKTLIQKAGDTYVVVNPTLEPFTEEEVDKVYDLPYTRLPHPKYHKKPAIPAYEMIRHSVNIHRGCFGGCTFCTISAHQGKFISSRSEKSVLKEVEQIREMEDFKGYLSDLGGPSANMYQLKGKDMRLCKTCQRPSCIYPKVCKNLDTNPKPMIDLYKKVRTLPYIKKAFVGSGVRYDMFMESKDQVYMEYFRDLIKHHVSGRLKVAPEHTSDDVLHMMRKPSFELFKEFKKIFDTVNKQSGLKQQLIPYFISSHPGSKKEDMADLAIKTKTLNFRLEQVQDFTPTPMTLATVMYYSGIDPYTEEKVFTARNKNQKLSQRQFFFWYKKEYQRQIKQELTKIGRTDLIEKLFKKESNHL